MDLNLKDVIDLGASGLQIVMIWLLWKRLNEVIDRLFSYLESARLERHKMASEVTALKLESDKRKNGE